MKTFFKILGLAIVGTALMLICGYFAASVLRSCNREIVFCVLISIVALSMVAPLFTMECKKKWVTDLAIFCMAYFPIQIIIIVGII